MPVGGLPSSRQSGATPDELASTEFAAGSMAPKVRAACWFAERTGGFAAIGALVAAVGGILFAWWSGQLSPSNIGLQATIELLVIAVIGGLIRIEGAWLGALVYISSQVYLRELPLVDRLGEVVHAARDRRPQMLHRCCLLCS